MRAAAIQSPSSGLVDDYSRRLPAGTSALAVLRAPARAILWPRTGHDRSFLGGTAPRWSVLVGHGCILLGRAPLLARDRRRRAVRARPVGFAALQPRDLRHLHHSIRAAARAEGGRERGSQFREAHGCGRAGRHDDRNLAPFLAGDGDDDCPGQPVQAPGRTRSIAASDTFTPPETMTSSTRPVICSRPSSS